MTIILKGDMSLFGVRNIKDLPDQDGKLVTIYVEDSEFERKSESKIYKGILKVKWKLADTSYDSSKGSWRKSKVRYYFLYIAKKTFKEFKRNRIGRYYRLHSKAEWMLFKLEHDL